MLQCKTRGNTAHANPYATRTPTPFHPQVSLSTQACSLGTPAAYKHHHHHNPLTHSLPHDASPHNLGLHRLLCLM